MDSSGKQSKDVDNDVVMPSELIVATPGDGEITIVERGVYLVNYTRKMKIRCEAI